MSFDGRIDGFIDAWAIGELPPRKRQEGPVRVEEVGLSRVLYSYAEPIAAIYSDEMAIVSESGALERTSQTTNRHLRLAERALRTSAPPSVLRARLVQGHIPYDIHDWSAFQRFFNVVRPPNLSAEVKALWNEHERAPYDQGVWGVLVDSYLEHGFGSPQAETGGIFLDPERGFIIGNRYGQDVIVR